MKKGDKVRFLNEVGGGIVTGFSGKDTVIVRSDDGFDIPMLQKECVVVDTNDYNIAKVHTVTPKPQPAGSARAQKSAPAGGDEVSDDEKPITFKPRPLERREGEVLNVKLAFVPIDVKEMSKTAFEAYLVNDSNFYIDFSYLSAQGQAWKLRFRGTAEPNTKVFMEEFGHDALNDMEHVCVQFFAYKEEKTFLLKPAASVQLRIDGTKFYRLNTFGESDFFPEPALLLDVVSADRPAHTVFTDAQAVKEALLSKQQEDRPHPAASRKEHKKEGPLEIDLHATELLDTTAGMKPGEILEYQLGVFRRTMDENRGRKGQKIVFIHGKGEGVLRRALLAELRQKYGSCTFQDASFREYGFGATLVIVH